ncbi:MAG: hypothetical protein ABII93_06125 [Chrysiogenia bacterium]
MNRNSWVKFLRSDSSADLIEKHPSSFLLLALIAMRARRTGSRITGLEPGEALVGDYKKAGLTRPKYRTALEVLSALGFLTIKTTNKGTIVKLIDMSIFDINREDDNQQDNQQMTTKQPTDSHQITTNKKEKKEKNGKKKEGERPSLDELKAYISEKGYNVSAERFYNHYEANGWMVGKNRMKSWTALVASWHHSERRQLPFGGKGRQSSLSNVGEHRPEYEEQPEFEKTPEQEREETIADLKQRIANMEIFIANPTAKNKDKETVRKNLEERKRELEEIEAQVSLVEGAVI